MDMSVTLMVVMLLRCMLIPKLIELYTLSMYRFLCVNHTLIKWFKRKKTYLRKGISEVQVLLVLAKLNTKYINMKYEL